MKSKKLEKLANEYYNIAVWVFWNRHLKCYQVQRVDNGNIIKEGSYESLAEEFLNV